MYRGYGTLLITVLMKLSVTSSENLYGASVHWRPSGVQNEIVLSYRLVWENTPLQNGCTVLSSTPQCILIYRALLSGNVSATKFPPANRWAGYKWVCTSGCRSQSVITDMSELFYTDVATFHELKWEAAIEMTTFKFDVTDDMANIKIGFQAPNGSLVDGVGEGHLSLAVRNDTHRPNISPALNVFPVYRIPLECSIRIKLFPFDGDGDYVKCHWEKFPSISSPEAKAVLFEDECEVDITATSGAGFHAGQHLSFSVYAEDYTTHAVKFSLLSQDVSTGPFSRTPVKFLVYIGNATASAATCQNGPQFERKNTLKSGAKGSYQLPFYNKKLPFKVPEPNKQVVLSAGPRFMIFKRNTLTESDEGIWWRVEDPGMKGIHQGCGMVYTRDGIPGESRCAVLMVNDPDECLSNPCRPDEVCDNWFEYYTCTARDNTTSSCRTVSKVSEGNDDLGLKVGLPVGLSLLLLIIIIAIAAYLKRYFMDKMKKTGIDPHTPVDGLGSKVDKHLIV